MSPLFAWCRLCYLCTMLQFTHHEMTFPFPVLAFSRRFWHHKFSMLCLLLFFWEWSSINSKVRLYLYSMGKDPTVSVSDYLYIFFRLHASCFWPSRTTLHTLCKHDQLFDINCAADTTQHWPITNFKISKVMKRKPLPLKFFWKFKLLNELACLILPQ